MKQITAIIEPTKLNHVRSWLIARGFNGVTVIENRNIAFACSNESDGATADRPKNSESTLTVEVAVADDSDVELVNSVLTSFCAHAEATPCVHSIDHVIRIRTGETGLSAL